MGEEGGIETMEVEMKIRTLMMDPVTQMPIVVLRDATGNSILPIWVGVYEANAIALEIEKISTPRPMTHDLIKTLLMGIDARVDRIVVNELKDDTFYAVIWIEKDGQMISIDSRPSDALAIALRTDSPIFVNENVLKNSRMSVSQDKGKDEELRRLLENLNEEDFGRYKM
jgi:bifunctional DNase/RNase